MIILDTNIISSMLRPDDNPAVVQWSNKQDLSSFWMTCITVYEILYGFEASPTGKRIQQLAHEFQKSLIEDFDNRILVFDLAASKYAATLSAKRKRSGIVVDLADIQIAGIAIANKAKLATRNIRHFADAEIELINPWDE